MGVMASSSRKPELCSSVRPFSELDEAVQMIEDGHLLYLKSTDCSR